MLNFVGGIVATARRNSAAPALITGDRSISYGEVLDMIARVANHLASRGLPPRAKLFLNIADPDLRLVVMIAAMHAGFIPFALLEIGDLGDEVDHDCVVGSPNLQLAAPPPDLVIDQSILGGRLSDGTLREYPARADSDILFVGSTTGTTGRRKLVAETYGSARRKALLRGLVPGLGDSVGPEWMRFRSDDRLMSALGDVTYFGFAIALQTLASGAVHVRWSHDMLQNCKVINATGVTRILLTPGTAGELMDVMEQQSVRGPSVKRLLLVGSLFDKATLERIEQNFDAQIAVAYGSSEAGRISSGVISAANFRPGYVGELFDGARLVAAGTCEEPARVVIARDEDTLLPYYAEGRAVPLEERSYTMPDLGYAEGTSLFITGRDDEVYNLSGNKIAFSTIDAALRSVPDIKDLAIVSAVPIGDVNGLLIGVVAGTEASFALMLAKVCDIVRAPRAEEHIHLFRLEAVPRNAFGKTDRRSVVKAYLQQTILQTGQVPLQ